MDDCPCEGKHSRMWHVARGLPQCEHVKALRAREGNNYKKRQPSSRMASRWEPGTSIYVPDYEEP